LTLEVSREGRMVTISGPLMSQDQIILTKEGPKIVLSYDAMVMRHLWGQLGDVIQQAEAETVHEPKQGGF
jgi:hypothetical protein